MTCGLGSRTWWWKARPCVSPSVCLPSLSVTFLSDETFPFMWLSSRQVLASARRCVIGENYADTYVRSTRNLLQEDSCLGHKCEMHHSALLHVVYRQVDRLIYRYK